MIACPRRAGGHRENARVGYRRGRLHRLAPVRAAAGAGRRRPVRRQPLHRQQGQHRAPAGRSALRVPAARRDLPAVRRGRRDLQPRVPREPDPLPARSRADHQDQRARRHQHAGPGQAHAGRRSCRPAPARCTATRRCTRRCEEYWGHVNPIGPRSCYDEGKRAAETLFFDYHRQHGVRIKVARIFNTYGPRMTLNDGRVVSNFIVQALRGEDRSRSTATAGRRARSAYVDDLVDGLLTLMDSPDDVTGPVNLGNPDGVHHPRARRRDGASHGRRGLARRPRRCRRTTRASASRTSRAPASCSAGSRHAPRRRAWADDRVLPAGGPAARARGCPGGVVSTGAAGRGAASRQGAGRRRARATSAAIRQGAGAGGVRARVFDRLGTGHRSAVRWGPLVGGDLADGDAIRHALEDHAVGAVIHFAAFAYVGESMRIPAHTSATTWGTR